MRQLLGLALLSWASASTDTFRFTQCECPLLSFSSEQRNNFPNAFEASSQAFGCPGDSEFPTESGVVLNPNESNSTGSLISRGVNKQLFQEQASGERRGWQASFQISFVPILGAQFNLINIFDKETSVFSVATSLVSKGGLPHLKLSLNAAEVKIPATEFVENSFKIIAGELFQASINEVDIFDASFICASTDDSSFSCSFSDVVMRSLSEVKIEVLRSTSSVISAPIVLSMIHFEESSFTFVQEPSTEEFLDTLGSIAAAVFDQNVPKVISLPSAVSGVELVAFKNTDLPEDVFNFLINGNVDLSDISISSFTDVLNGTLDLKSLPLITYTPDLDFVGNDSFSFSYGISTPFICENRAGATIVVHRNVIQIPEDLEEDVFATIPHLFSRKVAIDLANSDNEINGIFQILNDVPGFISETCGGTERLTEAVIRDGIVEFCYIPDSSVVTGIVFSLLFQVVDGNRISEIGSVNFIGNSPVYVSPQTPVETGSEDISFSFSLGDGCYGQKSELVPIEESIGIRITKLPSTEFGVLMDSEFNILDRSFNFEFSEQDILFFVPRTNAFNALEGLPNRSDGELVRSCESTVTVQNIESYCEISFEYKVFIGEVESEVAKALFLINAVDDGDPTINVRTGINDIIISSDAGANVFLVKMRILAFNGAIFKVIVIEELKGKYHYQGLINEEIVNDCTQEFCTVVDVIGTPSQLQELASKLLIEVTDGAVSPSIKLEVVASDEDFGDGSEVTIQIVQGGGVSLFTDSVYFLLLVIGGGTLCGSIMVINVFGENNKIEIFNDATIYCCPA